jgi:hypothetical protein
VTDHFQFGIRSHSFKTGLRILCLMFPFPDTKRFTLDWLPIAIERKIMI